MDDQFNVPPVKVKKKKWAKPCITMKAAEKECNSQPPSAPQPISSQYPLTSIHTSQHHQRHSVRDLEFRRYRFQRVCVGLFPVWKIGVSEESDDKINGNTATQKRRSTGPEKDNIPQHSSRHLRTYHTKTWLYDRHWGDILKRHQKGRRGRLLKFLNHRIVRRCWINE